MADCPQRRPEVEGGSAGRRSPLVAAACGRYKTLASGRSVAQPGSAPRSGRGGRRFKSCHSDQLFQLLSSPAPSHPDSYPDRNGRDWGIFYPLPVTSEERPREEPRSTLAIQRSHRGFCELRLPHGRNGYPIATSTRRVGRSTGRLARMGARKHILPTSIAWACCVAVPRRPSRLPIGTGATT